MSMRKAINDKCRECIYDPAGGVGTWRQQVENCIADTCPLYPYRPLSKKAKSGEKRAQPEALRRYREGPQE